MLGQGIYTFSEASRLTGIPTKRLRRWVEGYDYRDSTGGTRRSGPVVRRNVRAAEEPTITFLDLLEAMFVDRFLKAGVTMPTIRHAAEEASRAFAQPHPFCLRRFRTDGRSIFAEVARDEHDVRLLDVVKKQAVFREVFDPLLSQIDYDVAGLAVAWSPMGVDSPIVVDPRRAFGQPIVRGTGVTTRVLSAAVMRGTETAESVAHWYDVDVESVRAAVAFEGRERAAA